MFSFKSSKNNVEEIKKAELTSQQQFYQSLAADHQFIHAFLNMLWQEMHLHLHMFAIEEKNKSWFSSSWSWESRKKLRFYQSCITEPLLLGEKGFEKLKSYFKACLNQYPEGKYGEFTKAVLTLLEKIDSPAKVTDSRAESNSTTSDDSELPNACPLVSHFHDFCSEFNQAWQASKTIEERQQSKLNDLADNDKRAKLIELQAQYPVLLSEHYQHFVSERVQAEISNSYSYISSAYGQDSLSSIIDQIAELYNYPDKSWGNKNLVEKKDALLSHLQSHGSTKYWLWCWPSDEYKKVKKILDLAVSDQEMCAEKIAEALVSLDNLESKKRGDEAKLGVLQKIRSIVNKSYSELSIQNAVGRGRVLSDITADTELKKAQAQGVILIPTPEEIQTIKNMQRDGGQENSIGNGEGFPQDKIAIQRLVAKTLAYQLKDSYIVNADNKKVSLFLPLAFSYEDNSLKMHAATMSADFLQQIEPIFSISASYYYTVLILSAALFRASVKAEPYLRSLLQATLEGEYNEEISKLKKELKNNQLRWLSNYLPDELDGRGLDSFENIKEKLFGADGVFSSVESSSIEAISENLISAAKDIAGHSSWNLMGNDNSWKTIKDFADEVARYSKADPSVRSAYVLCKWYLSTPKGQKNNPQGYLNELLAYLSCAAKTGAKIDAQQLTDLTQGKPVHCQSLTRFFKQLNTLVVIKNTSERIATTEKNAVLGVAETEGGVPYSPRFSFSGSDDSPYQPVSNGTSTLGMSNE